MNRGAGYQEDLVRCPVCDIYIKKTEGFFCPKCKRGPLCRKHRVTGMRECVSCVYELKSGQLQRMRREEHSLRSFLRLSQFVFIVSAILFVSVKTGIAEIGEFLHYSGANTSFLYLGGLSVVSYVFFFLILYNQRQKIREIELQMTEFRRTVR